MMKSEVVHAKDLVSQSTEHLVESFNSWFEAQYGQNPARVLLSRDASCSAADSEGDANTFSSRNISDKPPSLLDSRTSSSVRKPVRLLMTHVAKEL